MTAATPNRASLKRYAWLSLAVALLTIALKTAAYLLTGSVGLLSDALESVVNLAGAPMALTMLAVAARPADEAHPHGHGKTELFSSAVEGVLILVAASGIAAAAVERLMNPRPLEQIGLGVAVSVLASLANLVVALVLLQAAERHRSSALEGNAQHLLTDVWTSGGVLVGIGAVVLDGWEWLDPAVALLLTANIVWTGLRIMRKSVAGLMDTALPAAGQAALQRVLDAHREAGVQYHALRTRQSGSRRFVDVHVLVPGGWSVAQGHQFLERLETDIRRALPQVSALTHLEALQDPAARDGVELNHRTSAWADLRGRSTAPQPDGLPIDHEAYRR